MPEDAARPSPTAALTATARRRPDHQPRLDRAAGSPISAQGVQGFRIRTAVAVRRESYGANPDFWRMLGAPVCLSMT